VVLRNSGIRHIFQYPNIYSLSTLKKRALPITWLVAEGSKGHFSEESHITLIEQVNEILPEGADVMFLGDGEFDGNGF